MKAPYLSKTLWINLIVAATAFFPYMDGWVQSHTTLFMTAFAAVNFVLRLVTKDKIGITD